jgi:predicted esterase
VVALVGLDTLRPNEKPVSPFLVVAGQEDPRFPFSYMQACSEDLKQRGAAVTFTSVPGDHFILFTSPETVVSAISSWLPAPATP